MVTHLQRSVRGDHSACVRMSVSFYGIAVPLRSSDAAIPVLCDNSPLPVAVERLLFSGIGAVRFIRKKVVGAKASLCCS